MEFYCGYFPSGFRGENWKDQNLRGTVPDTDGLGDLISSPSSHGMKQKLAIISATLIRQAELLVTR